MANITNKRNIFFVTSPRTPFKMRDEIKLLIDNFQGKKWDKETQTAFAEKLSESDFFEGKIEKNLDFAARDRINRSPKALGFVNLSPVVELTSAGKQFLYGKRPEEVFLRQLLKFQLPSPYHIDKNGKFNIKPYLELIRATVDLGGLSKDEIAIFIMQLTNVAYYDEVKNKILTIRDRIKNIDRRQTSYRRTIKEVYREELTNLYRLEISEGNILTRQSSDNSLEKFIETKGKNFRDYADAAIRYLRATQLLSFEYKTNRLIHSKYKIDEIQFLLNNVDRSAKKFASEEEFKAYLFSDDTPSLLSDNVAGLITELKNLGLASEELKRVESLSTDEIKDIRDNLLEKTKETNVNQQVQELQTYTEYEDIVKTYDDIAQGNIVDPALVLEWNTWRAFTMLDDGKIVGNFRFDLQGMPLFNAPGNKPDIECEYKKYNIIVEVTLSSGQKQYEMEGEPVARHLGMHQREKNKETYCIFLTKKLSQATLAHFYSLHKIDIAFYGGKAKIIPVEIEVFQKLLKTAYQSKTKPTSEDIYKFVSEATSLVSNTSNELEWYQHINALADNWYEVQRPTN